MAWGIRANSAVGRGFDVDGLCGRIMNWATQSQANHGAAWVMIDDQSALPTNPYIIIADRAQPWTHSLWPKIIMVMLPTATSGYILFRNYYTWDPAAHTGVPGWYGYIHTLDAGAFPYWLRGGLECLHIASWPGGDAAPSYAMIDEFDGDLNELEAQSHSGSAISPLYLESGDTGGLISGWHNLAGLSASTTDANGNIHLSIINTSGSTYRLDIFRDAARTERVAFSSTFTNTVTGAKSFTADTTYSAGLTGNLTTLATVSPNISISCRCLRVELGAGEGANITTGQPYYLIDFSGNTVRVSYSTVVNKVGDLIQLASIRSGFDFSSGSYLSPYPMRWYCVGDRSLSTGTIACLGSPLQSRQGFEYQTSFTAGYFRMKMAYDSDAVLNVNPDDSSPPLYRISRGSLREWLTDGGFATSMNRIYGRPKNMVMGSNAFVTIMSGGRSNAGVNYVAFAEWVSNTFQMIRDTESA